MPTIAVVDEPNPHLTRCWVCGDPDKPVRLSHAVYRASGEPVPGYQQLLLCAYHRGYCGDDKIRYEAIEKPRLHL